MQLESLFAERGIRWITRAHVSKVEAGRAHYETVEGDTREAAFDFAMLLPPFPPQPRQTLIEERLRPGRSGLGRVSRLIRRPRAGLAGTMAG